MNYSILFLVSLLNRQAASAEVGRTNGGQCVGRGIGDFAEGLAEGNASRAKDPGLCCSIRLCGMALCVKKPFADEPFGYFVATK
jgi:hypothetical protein